MCNEHRYLRSILDDLDCNRRKLVNSKFDFGYMTSQFGVRISKATYKYGPHGLFCAQLLLLCVMYF